MKRTGVINPDSFMDPVHRLMMAAIENQVFPGGVLLASKNGSPVFFEAFGLADIYTGEKAGKETVYDLASLTKPLATTLAVMDLVKTDHLTLDTRISEILPEYEDTDKRAITMGHLLSHTAGLPDYLPYYKKIKGNTISERKKDLRRLLQKIPLQYPLGRQAHYSDPGFMILNHVIETVSRERLDGFVSKKIYGPLGVDPVNGLFFVDLESGPHDGVRFAATERCPWRGRLIKGEVHDENAYRVGGIEGHAGLFGKAGAVHALLSGLLAMYGDDMQNPLFSPDMMELFFREHEKTGRTLGFDMPSPEGSSAGKYFSRNTVGHLGFSGTSFWMDLDRHIIIVLLTNRIHPTRENTKIKSFRPILHNALMIELQGVA
ncbi:MAG: serine hydrolase [Proteobacteria bacterium]|nr:serine hydrolase [Pseudomonadota bacterium]MBU4469290.1 serine hydrolase [Pseudomonadota bacterium]MCG2750769.1 serine hydrolase [Desulfobacteraceae bacterium]